MSVADIIALYGQEGYRRLENQAVHRVIEGHQVGILAVAGGIVAAEDTYDLLRERFHTIWLRALPEEHMNRVRGQGDERPMAGNPAALDDLKAILNERERLYAMADVTLDTFGQTAGQSTTDLVEAITSRGFLA